MTWGPMAKVISVLLAVLCTCVNASGCVIRDSKATPVTEKCTPKTLPDSTLIGANVVHHEDDPRRGYGTQKSAVTLRRLADLGLSGVVLPVNFSVKNLHSTTVAPGKLMQTPSALRKMIRQAKRHDLHVVVVPHLQILEGGWRGDLTPTKPGSRPRDGWHAFLKSYSAALRPLVQLSAEECVQTLSFAVELKSLSAQPFARAEIKPVLDEIRRIFPGNLTYSANWDEAAFVPYWDLLDIVSMNAFFPLASTSTESKDIDSLREEAVKIHRGLGAKHRAKPIWFLEVGFKSVVDTAIEPWRWPAEVPDAVPSQRAQSLAYSAHAHALEAVDAVDAMFFWVLPSDPADRVHPYRFEDGHGFSFLDKEAENVVRKLTEAKKMKSPTALPRVDTVEK